MEKHSRAQPFLSLIPSCLIPIFIRRSQNVYLDPLSDDDEITEASLAEKASISESHRHVLQTSGNISRKMSYFSKLTSLLKCSRKDPAPPKLSDVEVTVTSTETGPEPYAQFDLDYLYHCIESFDDNLALRKRTAGDGPDLQWLTQIDQYLAELLRLEGRGVYTHDRCAQCDGIVSLAYRCEDCHDHALYCAGCTVVNHARHPLHRLKQWSGKHFTRVSLKSLGLRVQLGHAVGERCCDPITAFGNDFVVLDIFGVHEVSLDFCGCEHATAHHIQLLRNRWFPATLVNPKTAATFRLMESFHLLSVQSKVSPLEFYRSLSRRTDNTGLRPRKDRYPAFSVMIGRWRHLKMLKRAGCGNDPGGVAASPPEACVIDCPACPHPGKNTSDDCDRDPPRKSWLHYECEAIDDSCYDMSGIFSVSDLRKGERQTNVDYPLNFAFPHHRATSNTFTSYDSDVLCNHSLKFHLNTHHERCHSVHRPRQEGEDIERNWAFLNRFATSTKKTGPVGRPDILDDVLGDHNWYKVTKMATTLLNRIKLAVSERESHVFVFEELSKSLPPQHITKWREMVLAWEKNPTNAPNPYQSSRSHITQNQIRVELALEDAEDVRLGKATSLHGGYSASTLVISGIDLEDQQRRLLANFASLGVHPTATQRAELIKQQNTLQHEINVWCKIQQLFIPGVLSLRNESIHIDNAPLPQNIALLLPSAVCTSIVVPEVLLNHEWRLREAQAHDALTDFRRHVAVRAHIVQHKDQFVRGLHEHTKSSNIIDIVEAKIALDAQRYRAASAALTVLADALGKVDLRDSPSLCILDDSWDRSGSEAQVPWISLAGDGAPDVNARVINVSNNLLQDSLRVEWCKARARALRWTGECELLRQEMRRVLAYHRWRAEWWGDYVGRNYQERPDYLEGANAYAHRQISLCLTMQDHCRHAWRHVDEWVCLGGADSSTSRPSSDHITIPHTLTTEDCAERVD